VQEARAGLTPISLVVSCRSDDFAETQETKQALTAVGVLCVTLRRTAGDAHDWLAGPLDRPRRDVIVTLFGTPGVLQTIRMAGPGGCYQMSRGIYHRYISRRQTMAQTAKLFMNGRSQAVRLPAEFRFSGREVFIEREGDTVILRPKPVGWDDFFARPSGVPADFLVDREDREPEKRELF